MRRTKPAKSLKEVIRRIKPTLKKYGIRRAGIFGSFVRGKHTKGSDIDILVDYDGSLLTLVSMERELAQRLGRKVDLLTYGGINPLLKKRILAEEIRVA